MKANKFNVAIKVAMFYRTQKQHCATRFSGNSVYAMPGWHCPQ